MATRICVTLRVEVVTRTSQVWQVCQKYVFASVKFGKYAKNMYLRVSSLASMTKIDIRVKASLARFGKFIKFGHL